MHCRCVTAVPIPAVSCFVLHARHENQISIEESLGAHGRQIFANSMDAAYFHPKVLSKLTLGFLYQLKPI